MIQPIPGFDDSYYEENGLTVWEQEENYSDEPVKSLPETGEPLTSLPVSGEPLTSLPVSGEPVVSVPVNEDIVQFEATKVEPLFKVSLHNSQVDSQDNKSWSIAGKDRMDIDKVEVKMELKKEAKQNIASDSWRGMGISEHMKFVKNGSLEVKLEPADSKNIVKHNILQTLLAGEKINAGCEITSTAV